MLYAMPTFVTGAARNFKPCCGVELLVGFAV